VAKLKFKAKISIAVLSLLIHVMYTGCTNKKSIH